MTADPPPYDPNEAAKKIADGHAYEKHVVKEDLFPAPRTRSSGQTLEYDLYPKVNPEPSSPNIWPIQCWIEKH